MNKFIKEQLEHVEGVLLPYWDDSTTHMEILHNHELPDVKVAGCYKVELRAPMKEFDENVLLIMVSKIVGETMIVDARDITGTHNYQRVSIPMPIVKVLEKY